MMVTMQQGDSVPVAAPENLVLEMIRKHLNLLSAILVKPLWRLIKDRQQILNAILVNLLKFVDPVVR